MRKMIIGAGASLLDKGSRISNLIIGGLHFSVGSAAVADLLRFKKLNSLDWDLIYLPGKAADVGSLRQRSEAANAVLFGYESNENRLHGDLPTYVSIPRNEL
jgi:hypothetical protein